MVNAPRAGGVGDSCGTANFMRSGLSCADGEVCKGGACSLPTAVTDGATITNDAAAAGLGGRCSDAQRCEHGLECVRGECASDVENVIGMRCGVDEDCGAGIVCNAGACAVDGGEASTAGGICGVSGYWCGPGLVCSERTCTTPDLVSRLIQTA